jgi:hypothetical protein
VEKGICFERQIGTSYKGGWEGCFFFLIMEEL